MKAAIDIGTNTVLLLVAELDNGKIQVLHEEQRIPRLGRGVDENRKLDDESMSRTFDVLGEYRNMLDEQFPEVNDVVVTATSAVRDASNRKEFMKTVSGKLGFDIRLLSGEEEAQWTFDGALSVIDTKANDSFFVLDIGGGSTEIALGSPGKVGDFYSFDMGCVRFRERFLTHDPPYQEEIFQCREEIEHLFSTRKFKASKKVKAIGVAGTATSLAAIDLQLEEYENEKLNGHIIKKDDLIKSIDVFSLHTYDQLLALSPRLLEGREDIFLAGLLILEGFMKFYSLDQIQVSTGGIRHGALLNTKKD